MDEVEQLSWEVARRYVISMGAMPAFITHTIRNIRNAQKLFGNKPNHDLKDVVAQITNKLFTASPTYHSVLNHAAQEMYPEFHNHPADEQVAEIVRSFSADETIAIVLAPYLYRRLKQRCDSKDWEHIELRFRQHSAIGKLIGESMPELGLGAGMVLGLLRSTAFSLLASATASDYRDYKRKLGPAKVAFDLNLESDIFGSTHFHIAAQLALSVNMGQIPSSGIMGHLNGTSSLVPDALPWHKANLLLNYLTSPRQNNKEQKCPDGLNIPAAALAALSGHSTEILADKFALSWIMTSKDQPEHETTNHTSEARK